MSVQEAGEWVEAGVRRRGMEGERPEGSGGCGKWVEGRKHEELGRGVGGGCNWGSKDEVNGQVNW